MPSDDPESDACEDAGAEPDWFDDAVVPLGDEDDDGGAPLDPGWFALLLAAGDEEGFWDGGGE